MRRDRLLLGEMVEAGERIVTLGRPEPEQPADLELVDALFWNFTVLGEASAQVSPDVQATHTEVPWADPVRLRNRIVHGYWSIDVDVLVSAARHDVPWLIAVLRTIAGDR
jgi:uncharacterized protein with HEPN domain